MIWMQPNPFRRSLEGVCGSGCATQDVFFSNSFAVVPELSEPDGGEGGCCADLVLKLDLLVALCAEVCPGQRRLLRDAQETDQVRPREAHVRSSAPREVHFILNMLTDTGTVHQCCPNPYSVIPDPESAFQVNPDLDPIPDLGFYHYFFGSNIAISLSLGFLDGRQLQEKPSALKR